MTARTKWSFMLSVALGVGALAAPSAVQSLTERVRTAPDGDVTFRFALKDDVEVCDHGVTVRGSSWRVTSRGNRRGICATGEGEILLKVRDGAVVEIDLRPPSIDRSDTDLGFQDSEVAAEFLLSVAADRPRESVAEDAIAPAAMIDGVTIWPALLELAVIARPSRTCVSKLFSGSRKRRPRLRPPASCPSQRTTVRMRK